MCIGVFEERQIIGDLFLFHPAWRLFGDRRVKNQDQESRDQRETKYVFPTEGFGESWGKQAIQYPPIFPALARPITTPCILGGYQRPACGKATAKLAPAKPSTRPISSVAG